MDYEFLQQYWWILLSLVGAILVFLMFVQGGQTLIYTLGKSDLKRTMLINTIGRKWEFTFTTLVLFGGVFFAAFPLFYSVSFGGAYWVWTLLLLSFVIQAVSYEYRTMPANFLGKRTYETFLLINGIIGTVVVGVAVGTFFNGANFQLNDFNQSQWANHWHGLGALLSVSNLSLGIAVFFLARIQALLYFIKSIDDREIDDLARKQLRINMVPFLVAFLFFVITLLFKDGFAYDSSTMEVALEPNKYLHNLLYMPVVLVCFLVGVVLVLLGIYKGAFAHSDNGVWFSGLGTILTVFALLLLAGLGNTCYYPSLVDMQSSLHIQNSCSSQFTLKTMFWVSLLIPFVIAYIVYTWRAISNKQVTAEEMDSDAHIY